MKVSANSLPIVPREVIKAIGLAIELARQEKNWSQSNLAKRLGVSRQKLSRLEKGDPRIDVGTMVTAAWLLNIPLIQGLDFTETKTKNFLTLLIDVLKEQVKTKRSLREKPDYEDF